MNHEIKGDFAERAISALERIADELETANERNRQRDQLENYRESNQR